MSKIREELVCEVCLGVLSEPKILSCAHSFCRSCLQRVLATNPLPSTQRRLSANGANAVSTETSSRDEGEAISSEIECPTCHKMTSVPSGDANQLPASRLSKLLPVVGDLEVLRQNIRVGRASSEPLSPKQLRSCPEHSESVQEFYCVQCSILVCGHCMLAGHKTHIDQVKSAQEAQDKMIAGLRSLLQPSQEMLFTGEEAAERISELKRSVVSGSTATTKHIRQFFNQARDLLAEREAELVAKVEKSCVKYLSDLTHKEEVVRKNVAALSRHTDQIHAMLQQPGDMSMLTETCGLIGPVEENQAQIQKVFQSIMQNQSFTAISFQNSGIDFSNLGDLIGQSSEENSHLGEAGYVLIRGAPQLPTVRRPSHGDSEVPTYPIQPPQLPIERRPSLPEVPTCPIQLDSPRARFSIPGVSENLYVRARESLYDEPLYEEPYQSMQSVMMPSRVVQRPFNNSFRKRDVRAVLKYIIPCDAQMTNMRPCGVAVGDTDAVIVSDIHNHCVKVIAPSGKVVDTITDSQSPQQINSPVALASNSEGHLYILDKEGKKAIHRFKNGKFDGNFTSKASRSHKLGEPWGIAATDELIYVTDWHKSCIHIFNTSGKYKESLGCRDGQTSVLKHPIGVTVTPDGHLIVADQGSHCVWKIAMRKDMTEFQQIGSNSVFDSPYGVAVTQKGFIVVTDTGTSQVYLFSPSGTLITNIGVKGSEEGNFNLPRHVCVNSKGEIHVTDELNQRIQVFELRDNS